MLKKLLQITAAILLFVVPSSAAKYEIDPVHSDITFKVRHMVISKVSGRFGTFSGTFTYDEKKPKKWKVEVTIDASSIDTNNEKRDAHLKNEDFLDVKKYPTMTFKSTKVEKVEGNKAQLLGLLNLHGVEKPVTLDLIIGGVVKDPRGNTKSGFEATTTINRKDFGIKFNKALDSGGLVVGNEIEITIHVEGTMMK